MIMSDSKYTVTFKTAQAGHKYINDDNELEGSAMGHMWYELQENNEQVRSFGFQPKDSDSLNWQLRGPGEVKTDDITKYQEYLTPITIQITQQQYEELIKFGENSSLFGFNPVVYDGKNHNCVSYVFKALNLIGYNPTNIDPSHSTKHQAELA